MRCAANAALRVVVTSRRRGGLSVETVVNMPPLAADAARALLLKLGPASLISVDEGELTKLLDQLGGVPLAIVLAAGRLRILGVAELSARLAVPRACWLMRTVPASTARF